MSLLTEDEAKTKWCPMARLSEMGGTFNRCGPHAGLYCIASACMAWRWTQPEHPPILELRKCVPGETRPDGFNAYDMETDSWAKFDNTPTAGYCGAFGKPS